MRSALATTLLGLLLLPAAALQASNVAQQVMKEGLTPARAVQVSGRVRLNGEVPERAILRIVPRGNPGAGVSVAIGPDGRYATALSVASTCSVLLQFDDLEQIQGFRTEVTLKEGANTFDWDAVGGVIRVSFTGGNPAARVSLVMEGGGMTQAIGLESLQPVRIAQPFGTDTFTAAGDVVARAPITLSPSAERPQADVTLELVEHAGTLALRDETGAPIKTRIGAYGRLAAESSPGVYALKGLPLGVPLAIVAAGFAPACVVTTPGDTVLTLSRGRPMEVVFMQATTSKAPAGELLLHAGPPGCRVALSRLSYTQQPTAPGEPARFLIQNFPAGGRFTWLFSGAAQEISVPATGPVVIR